MRAVCVTDQGLAVRRDYPRPSISADEALIRVSLAGICSTDLELVKGYFDYRGVLGHEFVGVVEQASVPEWIGKRVVSSINFADPHTPEYAEFGFEHHPHRQVLGIVDHDGAMADYVTAPLRHLLEVPSGVPDRGAVFTEPIAAALRIAEQVPVRPSARVGVVGPGRLGLLIGKVLSLGGGDVTVLGRSDTSLALPQRWGLQAARVESVSNDVFDLVVEATGNSAGLEHALRLVKPLSTLVLKSTYADAPAVDLTKIVVGEVNVIGSRCGPFAPALRLLQREAIDVESMIDAEYDLDQAVEAFAHAAEPGARKILLRVEPNAP